MKNINHEDELSDILIDDDEDQEEEKKGRSKKLLLVVAMALILLLVVIFAIYALTREDEPTISTPPPNTTQMPSQTTEDSSKNTFNDIGINANTNLASSSQGSGKDKFEDIIAKIKNEQNKNANNDAIPSRPENIMPPVANNTQSQPSKNQEDIKDLFKPERPEPKPQPPAPAKPEPIVTEPTPPKPAPKPKPQNTVPPKTVNVPSDPNGKFFIQTASLSKFSDESEFAKKIKTHNLPYRVQEESVNDKTVYRVLIGPYGSKADAQKVLPTVKHYLEKEAFIKRVND